MSSLGDRLNAARRANPPAAEDATVEDADAAVDELGSAEPTYVPAPQATVVDDDPLTSPSFATHRSAPVQHSQPTLSHHLKKLREAGIVDSERRGLWAYYYVLPEAMEELSAWLS